MRDDFVDIFFCYAATFIPIDYSSAPYHLFYFARMEFNNFIWSINFSTDKKYSEQCSLFESIQLIYH